MKDDGLLISSSSMTPPREGAKKEMVTNTQKPTVALTLGDPAGIGAELIAKLLARSDVARQADIVLVGDPWLWQDGQAIAGKTVTTRPAASFDEVRGASGGMPFFLAVDSVRPGEAPRSTASAAGGASVLKVLQMCLGAVSSGQIDAICFAPLNKQAMKMSGMKFSDELHFFADILKVKSYICEFNTLGSLWTSRISSHIPFKDIGSHITRDRIKDAAKLIHDALRLAGYDRPRVAIAALNPHGGDGGMRRWEVLDGDGIGIERDQTG
ncbi:4-hydroxythreonine-4-phosphate dehydrogenase PdxA [Telmatospirillum sp.]|uniref:4-hydroxythreonine-4-phosphate dehydrogenase PdxA n=1 Tax=Telmatospirillum sp. TaxID=2079197 RepID=UPI0028435F72|nr:4-hydroxythreonine-4-phosphate dehydrogenase PdxA [Telmatospirillum sp.]MDR3439821.1 4-hydroxythreonine-4-phosphate dehydrogenase PdxA [Telmatospirillum sp.]